MTTKTKAIRPKIGDVVSIGLDSGLTAYGRVLASPLMAFYDMRGDGSPRLDDVLSAPVLFKIWVMHDAMKSGRWKVIGNRPLEESLQVPVDFFKIDAITEDYSIYRGGEDIPAEREQCIGLERAAVWSANHVEDRLRDHLAGVPNKWVESLAP